MKVKCWILLGGALPFGVDGFIPLVSSGMFDLQNRLLMLQNTTCKVANWGRWQEVAIEMMHAQATDSKLALIGFSGGGSRATWIASQYPKNLQIDLMVLYDPSPQIDMRPIGENVKRAINYHNAKPFMLGLGGGVLQGPHVEQVEINKGQGQWHMRVQYNKALHVRTVLEVMSLNVA